MIETVKIGDQIWQKSNLNVLKFKNGDKIPLITSQRKWNDAGKNKLPACCFFKNDENNKETQGVLYNWYAVSDPRGLAPEGFRVPSVNDWSKMFTSIRGIKKVDDSDPDRPLDYYVDVVNKLISKTGWKEDIKGTDEFDFCVQSFGDREIGFDDYLIGSTTTFWTTDILEGWSPLTAFFKPEHNQIKIAYSHFDCGYHVRCLKND